MSYGKAEFRPVARDFSTLIQTCSSNIQKITQNTAQIKTMVNHLGTKQDTSELQDRLQKIQHYTNQLAKETNRHLKDLGSVPLASSPSEQEQIGTSGCPICCLPIERSHRLRLDFLHFELLYGRQVRGPLDLLKDYWEHPEAAEDNIVAYVVKMRQRLEEMTALVQENMKTAQQNQKRWYDRKSTERVLKPGQQVLLLLPTSDNKLFAKWHGPYEVMRQVGAADTSAAVLDL
ncbi:syntaxin-12 isoform X3 [Poeciliopsis prolifica]|uniref:syntaxin-12 isoform X3 n=1 Tax=Poeciliopsis prolifica TaxID=188132 RepID=UPI002413E04D|nr:syntaxin-12 isoform X3 [Poeciliopsis prolifica]